MSIEAMRQALEALEQVKAETFHPAKVFVHNPAIEALRQAIEQAERESHQLTLAEKIPVKGTSLEALVRKYFDKVYSEPRWIEQAEKQEPVAWRTFDGEGDYDYRTYDSNEGYAQEWATRNPRHVSWVDALYTAPPQRQWVGLTDDEIKEIIGPWGETPIKGYTRKMFDQIEAKLQEKNR